MTMGKSGHSVGKWAVAAALLVAVAAGTAWASQSETASVPGGNAYRVCAQIVPGASGGVYGGKDWDDVAFSVGFGSEGLVINGISYGAYDPAASYSVTVDCRKVMGVWVASTVVADDSAGGVIVAQQPEVCLPSAAQAVTATGSSVDSLAVE